MAIHYFIVFYPLFMACFVIYCLGMLLHYWYGLVWFKIQERLYCSVYIKDDDDSFNWINRYMQEKKIIQNDRNLRCGIKKASSVNWWEDIFKVKDEKAKPEVEFKTGAGNHIFRYKGKTIWVNHSIGKPIVTGWNNTPTEPEGLTVCTYGNDTRLIKDFIEECMNYCIDKDKDKITIYEQHRWGPFFTKV